MSKPPKSTLAAPSIPLSEEIKYKQKCKDLKRRISQIEDQNDILSLRIARSKRAVQRMRLERALLLEKLEERTILKVDDSEGSPSPPPSVSPRTHKHRRRDSDGSLSPSSKDHVSGFTSISAHSATAKSANSPAPHSASAAPNSVPTSKRKQPPRDPNAPKRPQNAYIIFCDHEKERVRADGIAHGGENFDLTKAMAEAWRDLGDDGRKPYYELYDAEKARYNREMEAYVAPGSLPPVPVTPVSNITSGSGAGAGSGGGGSSGGGGGAGPSSRSPIPDDANGDDDEEDTPIVSQTEDGGAQDEDIEDEEMEDVSFGGGFTAVNRR
ncbi:hypothetical protein BZA70DRAFT_284911 [Myxozyma melibiosi]|uniref:HMG box domain-containing protein n=1 Tax=Myxozyma melibiosi TaxID=54550 RepID=A0ABR1EYT8_9ASCO